MSFKPTDEQVLIVDTFVKGKKTMKVGACAGSGKTSTCILAASAVETPGVYLCFNKSIAVESQKKFPSNFMCGTSHSFAYRAVVKKYAANKDKMVGSLRAKDTVEVLSIKPIYVLGGTDHIEATTLGYAINQCVKRFCQSDDEDFVNRHFEILPKFRTLPDDEFLSIRSKVLTWARMLWAEMVNPLTNVPLGHDGYVKVWQLSDPVINTVHLFVDEFQDTAPVLLSVLKRQDCQIVGVGDENQQIYAWRGAVNAMELFPAEVTLRLTQSFRFGQAIADFASDVLATIGCDYRITGNPTINSELTSNTQPVLISRTNSDILQRLLDIDELEPDKVCHVVGGVEDLSKCLGGIEKLQQKQKSAYQLFMGFNDWDEFTDYADKSGDSEAQKIVKLTKKFGVRKLKGVVDNTLPSEYKADVILTTAHKSKGREWPGVCLSDDFQEQPLVDPDTKEATYNKDETRLFYVAATRAINQLKIPSWAKELYCKKAEQQQSDSNTQAPEGQKGE